MKQDPRVQATDHVKFRGPWTSHSRYMARAIANATDGETVPTEGGSPLTRVGDKYAFGTRRLMSLSTWCSKISAAG